MIKVDASVFIQIINFLFLVWVMNKVVYKPIREVLKQRKAKVSGLEQQFDTFTNEAQEKDAAYKAGIRDARAKGLQAKESFLQAAKDEERAIIDKINQKAQAELAQVREKISQDAQSVQSDLEKEVDAFAGAIGEKILGRAI